MSPAERTQGETCGCPKRCQFCGARLKHDESGPYCGTKNCQWALNGGNPPSCKAKPPAPAVRVPEEGERDPLGPCDFCDYLPDTDTFSPCQRCKAIAALRARCAELERGDEQRVRDLTRHIERADKAERERDEARERYDTLHDQRHAEARRADAATARAEAAEKLHNECHDDMEKAQATAARLRRAVEEQSHSARCAVYTSSGYCDCWKSRALALQNEGERP